MRLNLYQVDAFATEVFKGNPAAVCPLEEWLPDEVLQSIALENNLSETAFFVLGKETFELRWFTPLAEVDLCGHATLGTAHVIFNHLHYPGEILDFETRSGTLSVARRGDFLSMDFPSQPPVSVDAPDLLLRGLGKSPVQVLAAADYLAVFGSEGEVRGLTPDFTLLSQLDRRGVIVTAPGDSCDFVSRFFAPKLGVPEDPVTGSAHCVLTPYWAEKLSKDSLRAKQVSARGGDLECVLKGDRVEISGSAVTFMVGEIRI